MRQRRFSPRVIRAVEGTPPVCAGRAALCLKQ
jgi:hypothetical protein